MPRDMNLICMILAYVSDAKVPGYIPLPEFQGYSKCEILQHVKLCEEAGYLEIVVNASTMMPEAIRRMTWNGYEALERRCKEE